MREASYILPLKEEVLRRNLDNGMTDMGKLGTDLVIVTCMEKSCVGIFFFNFVREGSLFGGGSVGNLGVMGGVGQVVAELSLFLFEVSFNFCGIGFDDGAGTHLAI